MMAADLPGLLPIFPLPRVILLPRVLLPLNIFEPRYKAMADHALSTHRLIGMVQSGVNPHDANSVYKTGCAGRIVNFEETDDGRYAVTLKGVCRFDIQKEQAPSPGGYRLVVPDWTPYVDDSAEASDDGVCREAVLASLRSYFDKMNMFCDTWETMQNVSCEKLVSTLSVICPFGPDEKQALLEAKTLSDRARVLQAVVENACAPEPRSPCCH